MSLGNIVSGGLPGTQRTKVALALALVVLLAGCGGILGDDDPAANGDVEPIDSVPADVDFVAFFDAGVIADSTTQDTVNGFLDIAAEEDPDYDGPTNYDEMLAEFQEESDLDPDGFYSAMAFGQAEELEPGDEYFGVIVVADWTLEEIAEAGDESLDDLEQEEYNGVTVYVEEDDTTGEITWITDLGGNQLAFGTESAIQDLIDTSQGDADALSGDLRDTYDGLEDGYLKLAMTGPDADPDAPVDETDELEELTAVYYTDGDNMNVDVSLTLEDEAAAENVEMEFQQMMEFAPLIVGDEEEVLEVLEQLELERDGGQVTLTFTTTPDQLIAVFEAFSEELEPPEDPVAPQVTPVTP